MLISVIICTRNRAEQLRHVLQAAVDMDKPEGARWELVIVDNGSTDHTPKVIEDFASRLPVRRVFEPKAGLSNARNRGVAEVAGDYICWTDDDVEIDRQWLVAYAEVFTRHPSAAVFGGRVIPVLQGATPAWFARNRASLGYLLAERDLGPVEIPLAAEGDQIPFGANYAVRTAEQRGHLYDPNLGVGPGQKRLGEETEVVGAILRAGGQGVWVPGAAVRHLIPQSRQTRDYVLTYQQAAGQTTAYLSDVSAAAGRARPFLGAPFWVWRGALTYGVLSRVHGLFGPTAAWLNCWQHYGYFKGALDYWIEKDRKR